MGMMPIFVPPGINLTDSDYSNSNTHAYASSGNALRAGSGRWVGGYNVEFVADFPQKIAGWVLASMTTTVGIPRALCAWRDQNGAARVGIGTETHLYYMLNGALTDITPLRTISTGTLTNPLTTTNGSAVVAVADSSQTLQNGDWVYLSAASAVGGLTILGWYQVSGRSGTGYNITASTTATSSAGPLGGTVTYQYPRVTLTNPFATTSGSPTVTVTHTAHGATAGNYVVLSGATAVAGLTLNGEYQVVSATTNTYTITASSNANATTTGGGSVSVIYLIAVQQTTSSANIGWGQGAYGVGPYGVGLQVTPTLANGWTLATYGNQLLSCPIGGTIYVFNPIAGGRSYPLLNAPTSINAMFVTPERFVVALGLGTNPMQIAWADQTDYTVWTTTPTNTANSGRTLVGGSYFTGGIAIRDGVSLISTDRCVFQMNYTGSNEVYSTPQIGDNCGWVDPTAICTEGGIAYWMGDQDFWMWNGGVQALGTDDVKQAIFQGGINRLYLSHCTATLNRAKKQVRFWYPSNISTDNDVGIIYHYDQQCFAPLAFGRTAAIDANLLSTPVSADRNGSIYYDETGTDAAGTALPWSLELGGLDISSGDRNADIFGFVPDFGTITGTIALGIMTKYYPSDTYSQYSPASLPAITSSTQRIDVRADGKIFGFQISGGAVGNTFRLGLCRLDVQPSGARQ